MSEQDATLDEFVGEGGTVSEEDVDSTLHGWEEVSIIDLCEIGGGSTPKKSNSEYWNNGEILWTTPKDFNEPRLRDTEDKITKKGAKDSTSKIYPPGTSLLVVRSGVLRHTLPIMIAERETTVNQDLKALEPDTEKINSEYLFQALDGLSEDIRGSCKKTGTTVESIQTNVLEQYPLPVPPVEEQHKIASVLYNIDQAIQKAQDIVDQAQRLKKGLIQNLFSSGISEHNEFQETQYGVVPSDWDVKPIRQIASRIGSGGTPDTDRDEYYGGNIAWVKTDDLNSGLVETTKTKITEQGLDESAAKLFPEGTVVFAMYGGALGQNGRLDMEAAMNQACCGIVTDETKMDPYFLHQQLIHRKQQLTALSAGTHQQNISQSMIEKFEVFVPPIEEQAEMIEVIRDIDTVIETNQAEKEQLERFKKGLTQNLLSGNVRTTDTNIEVLDEVTQHG